MSCFLNLWSLTTSFWTAVTFIAFDQVFCRSILIKFVARTLYVVFCLISWRCWASSYQPPLHIQDYHAESSAISMKVCYSLLLLSVSVAQPINIFGRVWPQRMDAPLSSILSFCPPTGNSGNVNVLLKCTRPVYYTNIYYFSLITGDLMLTSIIWNNKNGNMLYFVLVLKSIFCQYWQSSQIYALICSIQMKTTSTCNVHIFKVFLSFQKERG